MKRVVLSVMTAAAVCLSAVPAEAALIWDWSPATTGASGGDNFSNFAGGQNFGEVVSFATPVTVTGMDIYSSTGFGSVGQSATIRVWSDVAGSPGVLLHNFTELISVIDSVGAISGNNRKHVDFTTPIVLAAGTPFWIGMSGTSVGLGQTLYFVNPPGDTAMALFSSLAFLGLNGTGDVAFRLQGVAVPEPSSLALLLIGTIGIVGYGRRRRET